MKIAVGGSAANPPHIGHRMLVKSIIDSGDFDKVIWIVSGDRPDKPSMISSEIRWEMGMLLFSQIKEVEVRYEIGKSVPTFRVIDDLKGEFPGSDITWYCGSDHFLGRERFGGKCDVLGFWDRGDELFFTQKFLIFARKNIDRSRLQLPQNTRFCDSDLPDISSTKIRERLSINMPIDDLVGKDISAYITQNNISL